MPNPHPARPEYSYAVPPYPPRPTNTLAVLALVFGILGGVLAIPFGHIARRQIRRSGEDGNGLALAGLILGYIWLTAAVVAAVCFVFLVRSINDTSTDLPRAYADYGYSAPNTSAGPTSRSTPTTHSAATSAVPLPSRIPGTDDQGFLRGTGPRCNSTNPAVVIARTAESRVVVCRTGVGRYYYKGVRVSDGSSIELDDPVPTGSGFVATNGSVRYTLSSDSLVITDGTRALGNEPMHAYWHR
ncbi:DUF4190 domain-containing protein [Prescottella subtropica]|uniref:DUF4190 domain-containing protein n=1 Tax=Prescottella subtropica TaxID=2545757 RepID=UPI001386AC29|nr:DUF4190 domain-containing protein [Prescottella subtropica]